MNPREQLLEGLNNIKELVNPAKEPMLYTLVLELLNYFEWQDKPMLERLSPPGTQPPDRFVKNDNT